MQTNNGGYSATPGPSTIISHGFGDPAAFADTTFPNFDPNQGQHNFFTEDDLKFTTTPGGMNGGNDLLGIGFNSLGFDPSATGPAYRTLPESSSDGAPSPALNFGGPGIDIPLSTSFTSAHSGPTSGPTPGPARQSSKSRKLNNASASPALPLAPIGSGPAAFAGGGAGSFRTPVEARVLPANAVGHTGTATYSLSEDAELAQDEDGDGPVSELADGECLSGWWDWDQGAGGVG